MGQQNRAYIIAGALISVSEVHQHAARSWAPFPNREMEDLLFNRILREDFGAIVITSVLCSFSSSQVYESLAQQIVKVHQTASHKIVPGSLGAEIAQV